MNASLLLNRLRALQWFSDNWPDNAVWPEGVDRPTNADAAA